MASSGVFGPLIEAIVSVVQLRGWLSDSEKTETFALV